MSAKIHVVTSAPHQSPQKCKKICTNTTSAFRFFFFFNKIFYFFNFFFFLSSYAITLNESRSIICWKIVHGTGLSVDKGGFKW